MTVNNAAAGQTEEKKPSSLRRGLSKMFDGIKSLFTKPLNAFRKWRERQMDEASQDENDDSANARHAQQQDSNKKQAHSQWPLALKLFFAALIALALPIIAPISATFGLGFLAAGFVALTHNHNKNTADGNPVAKKDKAKLVQAAPAQTFANAKPAASAAPGMQYYPTNSPITDPAVGLGFAMPKTGNKPAEAAPAKEKPEEAKQEEVKPLALTDARAPLAGLVTSAMPDKFLKYSPFDMKGVIHAPDESEKQKLLAGKIEDAEWHPIEEPVALLTDHREQVAPAQEVTAPQDARKLSPEALAGLIKDTASLAAKKAEPTLPQEGYQLAGQTTQAAPKENTAAGKVKSTKVTFNIPKAGPKI